jgi:DNA replication protein DnaC
MRSSNTETLSEVIERINFIPVADKPVNYEPKRSIVALKYAGVAPKHRECSFDNFKGKVDLVRDLQASRESIFLTGNTGCGKTHLAISILRDATVTSPLAGYFITVPEMLMKIRSSFSNQSGETEEEIVKRFADYEVLVLDDLGSEKSTEYSITTLFLILDRRDRYNKRTIVTSNLSLLQIEDSLGARIASRLAGMNTIQINMPDYRKKR